MTRIAVLALLLLSACTDSEATGAYAIDGDTIVLTSGEHIRIENIDAAEMHARCPAELDLAVKAGWRMNGLVAHHAIQVTRSGTDKYGRTLARIKEGGIDLGELMVSEGLARPWTGRRRPWC